MNISIKNIFRFLVGILCYLESRISYYQNRRKILSVVAYYTIFIIYQSGIITVIVSPLVILLLKVLQISISSDIYSKAKILNLLIIIFRITFLTNGIIYYPNIFEYLYNPVTKIKYFVLAMFSDIYNKQSIPKLLVRFFITCILFIIFVYEISKVFMIVMRPDEITTESLKASLSSIFIFSFLLISIIMIINTRDDYKILRRKVIVYFINLITMIIVSIKTMQNIVILENENMQFSNYIQIASLFMGVILSVSYLKDTFDVLTNKYCKNKFLNEKVINCYSCNYSCFSFVRAYTNIRLKINLYLYITRLKYKKVKNKYVALNLWQKINTCILLVFDFFIFASITYIIYIIISKRYINKLAIRILSEIPENIKMEVLSIIDKFGNEFIKLIIHVSFILIPIISIVILIATYKVIIKIFVQSKANIKKLENIDKRILGKLIISSYCLTFLPFSLDLYFTNKMLTNIITKIVNGVFIINLFFFLIFNGIHLFKKKIKDYNSIL
ncbi:hypothetical protein [Senegalia massiliensis]|uniref:Uncharacterized protein n=1 Tax=Senegalia massiliensis TaxID=1720316 RepID=A0A845QV94_9CLOT|nr:hypothetical protein [Senegalia massiliensis]NBI06827.1 hypothetical protein [Senegalia massiliensis]